MIVELNSSRNLRLRWSYQGKRYYLSLGLDDTLPNRLIAEQLASKIKLDIDAGNFDLSLAKYRHEKGLTSSDLFQKWLDFKSTSVCSRTLNWYFPVVELLQEFFHSKPASEITKFDADSFVKFLLSSGSSSSQTIRRRIQSLASAWQWAIEFDLLLSKNPWTGLNRLVPFQPKKQPKPFTQSEISTILKAFEESERYCQLTPFVKFLFMSGLRTSEAIGLRWSDLSPDFKILTVNSQLTRKVRKLPKNSRVRSFELSNELIDLFKELAKNRGSHELIFLYKGKPFNDDHFFRAVWNRIFKQIDVPYRNPYTTRHTFISHSLQSGNLSPVEVSALCGNSPKVIYSHYLGLVSVPKLPSLNLSH